MKVVEVQESNVEVIGEIRQRVSFTIQATKANFDTWLKSVYSNPEKTVVRELMANAFDAHSMGGNAHESIRVFLPTTMDPSFIVRDFGIGMSHDFVMNLFSSVGYSTKKDTNEATGMFGIGSKSPLAISTSFTVRCFDKPGWNGDTPHLHSDGTDLNKTGRIRLYSIVSPDDDVPQISHTFDVAPRDVDEIERGGTEVKVPVSTSIRAKIIDGLSSQHFSWFDKSVEFKGALDEAEGKFYEDIKEISPKLYVGLRPGSQNGYRYGGNWRFSVRQGAAVYPLNRDSTLMNSIPESINRVIGKICDLGYDVMLDVPLGTAAVTASREALLYGEKTNENLKMKIEEAFEGFASSIEKHLQGAYSYAQAYANTLIGLYASVKERQDFRSRKYAAALIDLMGNKIKENYDAHWETLDDVTIVVPKLDAVTKQALRDPVSGNTLTEKKDVRPPKREPNLNKTLQIGEFPEGKVILTSGELRGDDSSATVSFGKARNNIQISIPGIVYVIPSHLSNWQARISKHASQTFPACGGLASAGNSYNGFPVSIIRCAKRNVDAVIETLKEHGTYVGHYGAEDLPSIEDDPQVKTTQRSSSKTSVYEWEGGQWSESKVEPHYDMPAYYIARVGIAHECYGRNPEEAYTGVVSPKARYTNTDIGEIIKHGRSMGFLDKDIPIYRVTEKQCDTITKSHPEWKHLINTVGPLIEQKLNTTAELSFVASALGSGSGYFLRDRIGAATRVSKYSDDDHKLFSEIIHTLSHKDELFKTVAFLQYGWINRSSLGISTVYNDAQVLRNASYSLFGSSALTNGSSDTISKFNALVSKFTERYGSFLQVLESIDRLTDSEKHLMYYWKGFVEDVPSGEMIDYIPELSGFAEIMDSVQMKIDYAYDLLHTLDNELTVDDVVSD